MVEFTWFRTVAAALLVACLCLATLFVVASPLEGGAGLSQASSSAWGSIRQLWGSSETPHIPRRLTPHSPPPAATPPAPAAAAPPPTPLASAQAADDPGMAGAAAAGAVAVHPPPTAAPGVAPLCSDSFSEVEGLLFAWDQDLTTLGGVAERARAVGLRHAGDGCGIGSWVTMATDCLIDPRGARHVLTNASLFMWGRRGAGKVKTVEAPSCIGSWLQRLAAQTGRRRFSVHAQGDSTVNGAWVALEGLAFCANIDAFTYQHVTRKYRLVSEVEYEVGGLSLSLRMAKTLDCAHTVNLSPPPDLMLFSYGIHCLFTPSKGNLAQARAWREGQIRGVFERLGAQGGNGTRLVYALAQQICEKVRSPQFVEELAAFPNRSEVLPHVWPQTPEGIAQMNAAVLAEGLPALRRARGGGVRVTDWASFTAAKCDARFSRDGVHYPPLDRLKGLVALLGLGVPAD